MIFLINLFARIGLIRISEKNNSIRWPFHISPWWIWKAEYWPAVGKRAAVISFFRNRSGVVKWIPGRLLPRRWGIKIFGFEFGDRGLGKKLILKF